MTAFSSCDPGFLCDLRAGVRERAARRGLRRLRESWRRRMIRMMPWLTGMAVVLLLTLGAGAPRDDSGLTPSGRSALWAYALCLPVLAMAQNLRARLNYWPDAVAALRLPASNDWLVQRQWHRVSRTVPWLAAGVFAAAAVAAWLANAGGAGLLAATVTSVGFVAISLPIATWLASTGWDAWISRGWWILLVVVWIGHEGIAQLQQWTFHFLNAAGDWIVWILPTGWLARPFLRFLDGDPWAALPAAVLVILTGLTLRSALRRLVRCARPLDWGLVTWFSQLPQDGNEAMREALESTLSAEPSSPVDEVRQRILSREFLEPRGLPTDAGWIECLLWRCWSPRERFLSGIAFPSLPRWTTAYHRIAMALVVLVPLACLAEPMGIPQLRWIWPGATVALLFGLFPVPVPLGRLSAPLQLGNGSAPWMTQVPISLGEVAVWTLKTAGLRILLGLPLALAFGAAGGQWGGIGWSPLTGMGAMAVLVAVLPGLHAVLLVNSCLGRVWMGLNVGRFGWLHGLLSLALLLLGVVLALLTLLPLFLKRAGPGLALASGAALCGGMLLFRTVRRWRRHRLELVIPYELQSG